MTIRELDSVVLERDLPDHGLRKGDLGDSSSRYPTIVLEEVRSLAFAETTQPVLRRFVSAETKTMVVDDAKSHCWHVFSGQHPSPGAIWMRCCFCAAERAVHRSKIQPPRHGPHKVFGEGEEVLGMPSEECPERRAS